MTKLPRFPQKFLTSVGKPAIITNFLPKKYAQLLKGVLIIIF